MSLLQSIILGIVQGLTEFLPVSSSGHLVIIPYIFNWEEHSTSYDVVLHGATLLALIIYFYKDLIKIIKKFDKKMIVNLIIVSIPIGIVGFFFEDFIDKNFKNHIIISFMLILIGILLIFSEKFSTANNKTLKNINKLDSFIIGLFQIFSLIRGTSRSGITLIGGLFRKLSLQEALRFSFLAGIPIMTVVFAKQLFELNQNPSDENFTILISGFLSAFISGLLGISFMMKFVKKIGLIPFGIYRIVLGIIVLIVI